MQIASMCTNVTFMYLKYFDFPKKVTIMSGSYNNNDNSGFLALISVTQWRSWRFIIQYFPTRYVGLPFQVWDLHVLLYSEKRKEKKGHLFKIFMSTLCTHMNQSDHYEKGCQFFFQPDRSIEAGHKQYTSAELYNALAQTLKHNSIIAGLNTR